MLAAEAAWAADADTYGAERIHPLAVTSHTPETMREICYVYAGIWDGARAAVPDVLVTSSPHSYTNRQVAGVDKSDHIQTDGDTISVLRNNIIHAMDADGHTISVKYADTGDTYHSIFMHNMTYYMMGDDTLAVLDGGSIRTMQTGHILHARMIDGTVYTVSVENMCHMVLPEYTTILPGWRHHSMSITTITAISQYDTTPHHYVMDAGGVVYVSKTAMYIAEEYGSFTTIHRIPVDTLRYAGSAVVPGWLVNQFAMDEYNGTLRVATTTFESSGIYVYDIGTINMRHSLGGIAPGESITSARFAEDIAYLVTF